MKKKLVLILLATFYMLLKQGYGQIAQNTTDEQIRSKSIADSLYNLGLKYVDIGQSNKALEFYNNSLYIYKILNDNKKVGDCYSEIGVIYYFNEDYPETLSYFNKSLNSHKKGGYKKGVAGTLNNIGAVYYYLGNYPKAVEYYSQAVVVQEEIGDKKVVGIITENIGGIFSKIKDYNSAREYFDKAYIIFKELKFNKGISKVLIDIGYVEMQGGKYDKAFESFNKSLEIANSEKDKQVEMEVLSNLGELFFMKSDFEKAQYYYDRCLKYAEEIKNSKFKSSSNIAIGNISYKLGRNTEAIAKCKAGLRIAEDMKAISVQKDACECLYNAYKSLKNTSLALSYYEKANMLKDSLQSEETSNRLMNMEVEKQQAADSVAYVQKATIIQQKHEEDIRQREKQRNIIIISLVLALIVAAGALGVLNFVRKSRAALRVEKDRSEALLLNILPEEIAEELKEKGSVGAKNYELVSILFSDFIGFTQISEQMSPESLVEEINECFKAFDLIAEKHQVEKIKTIGDAYMAAGGMPVPDENSYRNVVLAGLDMQQFMLQRASDRTQLQLPSFNMRLGIHVGPIVAGIVGIKKFQYDVWGDTVNTASRIESNGIVGKVNISESLYLLIKDEPCFTFESRGSINAKGKGDIEMYFVEKSDAIVT